MLDHILVTKEFYHLFDGHIGKVQCVQTFNDHLRDETLIRNNEPAVEGASDHGQLAVQIKIHENHIKELHKANPAVTPQQPVKHRYKRLDETL